MSLRVNEWELQELNPGKQFLTDFELCVDDRVRSCSCDEAQGYIDEAGYTTLLWEVALIHGVSVAKISKRELRVYKFATHSWEELTPQIRALFKQYYGDDIKFTGQNPLVLKWRRFRLELNS